MTKQIPEDLFYSSKNIWARVEDNHVTMGLTQYAAKLLCDDPPPGTHTITSIDIIESEIKEKAEPFGVCKNETKGMDLTNPLSYRLIERNLEAIENPAIVGQDPYGAGWLVRVEMLEPGQLDEMFNPEQYTEYTATNIPDGLYYSRNHIWLKEQEGDEVLIGINDYGVKLLCLYPAVAQINGLELGAGGDPDQPFGTITSQIHSLLLMGPLHFVTPEQNPEVMENPSIINQDPYNNGWIIKAQLVDPGELENLFTAEQYREYLVG